MKWFFERSEANNSVTIIFKPYSMYALLIILGAMTAITFVNALSPYDHFVAMLMPVAAAIIGARIVLMFKVNKEIQQAIRESKVKVSGGKLSAKNPLTFVITPDVVETPSTT